jgi:thiol-disulfide isomerase/thioredoxin
MSTEFILYGKADCHPCKVMLQELQQLNETYSFEIKTIDIREDPIFKERYGTRIPVLVADGVELCHFTLDKEIVLSHLGTEEIISNDI